MSGNSNEEKDSEITNLQISFNKQQAKISALKELVRQTEAAHGKTTSSAQEKVKNIAHRLTHLKSKARSRQNLDRSLSDVPILEEDSFALSGMSLENTESDTSAASSLRHTESPASEKIQLLRQQMEQNKLKIAQRENNKREIEEMVVQLKAKMDSTQQCLERSSELGRSMTDLSSLTESIVSSKFKSSSDISFTPINIDKERIKFLENRIHLLETKLQKEQNLNNDTECKQELKILENKILDLEENLKEKECIIQARTQAVGLMSENLSTKGKNTVDLLETTRAEFITMQQNFVDNEDTYREEIKNLKKTVEENCNTIANLEEMNNILEKNRFDLTVKISKLELENHNKEELAALEEDNKNLQIIITGLQKELAGKNIQDIISNVAIVNIDKKYVALVKENDDLKKNLQEFQNLKYIQPIDATFYDKVRSMEAIIEIQKEEIQNHLTKIQEYEEKLAEKTVEYNVLNANFSVLEEKIKLAAPKSLFSKNSNEEADIEINKLKQQLDESNKSMIKTKLKTKQLQKQVDAFKKSSESNNELIILTEKNQELQQQIIEMEDEMGQLQLKLVNYESDNKLSDDEISCKVQILETTCQNQTSAIQLLQEEKLELCETLQKLQNVKQQEFEILNNEPTDHSNSQQVKLISNFKNQIQELETSIEKHKEQNQAIQELLERSKIEKSDLDKKVDHYIGENIELLDKIEKLNKSSSSAESIEIVERLTQQEKLELEAFEQECNAKKLSYSATHVDKESATDSGGMGQELSDSLIKLREESSELMHKIDLFTAERREVLDKMEKLSIENQENIQKVELLEQEKLDLQARNEVLEHGKTEMEIQIKLIVDENSKLLNEFSTLQQEKTDILSQLSTLQNITSDAGSVITDSIIEKCEASLARLNIDIESFRKANDKNVKLQASKKLAKEAKNTVQQMDELFQKLKMKSDLKVDNNIRNNENALQNMQKEIDNSLEKCAEKDTEINILNIEMLKFKNLSVDLNQKISEQELAHQQQLQTLNSIQSDLQSKIETSEHEINILKTLIAEQKQQLIESYSEHELETNSKLEQIQKSESEIKRLKTELDQSQKDNNDKFITELTNEVTKLKISLNKNEEEIKSLTSEIHYKQETIDSLNTQIIDLYQTMEENTMKLIQKDEEICSLQELIETNNTEVIRLQKENDDTKLTSQNLMTELQLQKNKVTHLEKLTHLEGDIKHSQEIIIDLEKNNTELKIKNSEQLEKLKKFAANIKKKAAQCIELEERIKFLENNRENLFSPQSDNILEANIKQLQERIDAYEYEMSNFKHSSNIKIDSLLGERAALEISCASIDSELQNKITELKETQLTVESMAHEIESLKTNLAQQSSILADHNKKLQEDEENMNMLKLDIVKMENDCSKLDKENEILNSVIQTKNVKLDEFRAVLADKNSEIHNLKIENESLIYEKNQRVETDNHHLELKYNELNQLHLKLSKDYEAEVQLLQATISKMQTEHNGNEAKLEENMGYIEVLETENKNFKNEILKLEQCVASFEEKRASLEKRANSLDAELQFKTNEFEKNENALVKRINILSEHEEMNTKQLLVAQEEKTELYENLALLKEMHSALLVNFSNLEKAYQTLENEKSLVLSSENEILRSDLKNLQATLEKEKQMYEENIGAKHLEIDNLENDLSLQLQAIESEKKALKVKLERANDEITDLKDENIKLKESVHALEQIKTDFERELTWTKMQNENLTQDQFELQELRIQCGQNKNEIDNWKHQQEILIQNHNSEVSTLRTQIAELHSMTIQVGQNQTDDQMFIETENKRLKDMLKEKDLAIDMYQKTNLQLQMSVLSTPSPSLTLQPDSSVQPPSTSQHENIISIENMEIVRLQEINRNLDMELIELRTLLAGKDEDIKNLQIEVNKLSNDVSMLSERNTELQMKFTEMPEDKPRQVHVVNNSVASFFTSNQSTNNAASFFDEVVTSKAVIHPTESLPIVSSAQNLKEIEDLQKTVADLEKYTSDLENKLQHLTDNHEATLVQVQENMKKYNSAIAEYQAKIDELEINQQQAKVEKNVEGLIMTGTEYLIEPVKSSIPNSTTLPNASIIEEIITPEKAYLCEPVPIGTDTWDWGEDAELEEKHQASTTSTLNQFSLLSPTETQNMKIQDLEDKIQELIIEKNNCQEENKALQIKSAKIMKKLKEYKVKNDQLNANQSSAFRKSTSVESNDLDLAIQDELKSQLLQVEQKLLEVNQILETEKNEKSNLIKQIDMLVSGNDRMVELKEHQDIELQRLQQMIRELNQKVKSLEDWTDQSEETKINTATILSTKVDDPNVGSIAEVVKELDDIKNERDEWKDLFDEESSKTKQLECEIKLIQEKLIILENNQSSELEMQALTEKYQASKVEVNELRFKNQNLEFQLNDFQTVIKQLELELNSMKTNVNKLNAEHEGKVEEHSKLTAELQSWMDKNEFLCRKIDELQQNSQSKNSDLSNESSAEFKKKISELNAQLQYRELESAQLNQRIEEMKQEDQTNSLVQEIFGKNFEINFLKEKVNELESDNLEMTKKLQLDSILNIPSPNISNEQLVEVINNLELEKSNMEEELRVLNEHILASLSTEDETNQMILELDMKNIEIKELKNSIELIRNKSNNQAAVPNTDALSETNAQWEKKYEEIADNWKQYLAIKENQCKETEEKLLARIKELENTKREFQPTIDTKENSNTNEFHDSNVTDNMQRALENQELEIVTLKEQLALRSAEYARLAAQHDPYAMNSTSNDNATVVETTKSSNSNNNEKSQLDLTLYMLHQRDMRCEELALELVQLLEERDTLQLKLSNAIRQIESYKSVELRDANQDNEKKANSGEISESILPGTSAKVFEEKRLELDTKLSQLHATSYGQNQRPIERRERELERIQKDVAKMPSEAVSELIGADITNTTQSPSSIFLNWLWSNSNPENS